MNTLDSRWLRYTDCFAQKFSSPGQVRYRVTTGAGACLPVEGTTFTIDVNKRTKSKNESRQHNVAIRQEGHSLVASPPHLEIEVGGTVLWHAPNPSTPGFTVRGEGEGVTFDSSALTSEAIYTHAFGTPGDYEWVDANGGVVSGVVEVRSLDFASREECEKWLKSQKNGTLVTIHGEEATPDLVQILTGQTVFWAVEKSTGVSITDARLVRRDSPTRPQ
jgi:plastocyanin